jgi:hypothetical protein
MLIGGVPYSISAAAALLWLRGRSVDDHRRLALIAPLLFVPVLALGIAVSGSLGTPPRSARNVATLVGWAAFFSCLLGYVYVAIVVMLRPWFVRSTEF